MLCDRNENNEKNRRTQMVDNVEEQVKQEQIRQDHLRQEQLRQDQIKKELQVQDELRAAQIRTEDLKKSGLTDASIDAIN
jgi:hypothetical protein